MTAPKPAVQPKPLPVINDYGPNAIEVKDLSFAYSNSGSALVNTNVKPTLVNLNLTLETGSRCLLIGANGRYETRRKVDLRQYVIDHVVFLCHFYPVFLINSSRQHICTLQW